MTTPRPVHRWAVVVVAAALSIPLVVGVLQMREPTWHPVLDLAMTELRVRDVGTAETPLIGLPGRIGETLQEQGSHPGPASFYALAPTYKLLGSTSWALQVGSALIHAVAIGVALALARRRGGTALFAGVAVVVALLVSGYGTGALTEPWNPYLPLLWWFVLLLAVWSVLDGDVAALPVAALAGSFCAQTHVPYLALSVGLGTAAVLWALVLVRRAPADSPARRGAVVAIAAAVLVGAAMWAPPTVDQLTEEQGNYAKLLDHFASPPAGETPIGLGAGVEQALQRLDAWHLASHAVGDPGLLTNGSAERFPSAGRGAVVLVLWLVSAAATVAVRPLRHGTLVALHALVAGAGLLGAISITRIFGLTWYYLMLWMWAVGALMGAAVLWTAWRAVGTRAAVPSGLVRGVPVALAVVAAAVTVHTTAVDAVDAEPSDAEVSEVLAAVTPDIVAALERGEGAASGRDGRYHVTWRDAFHIGSQGFGLVSELEREGFDAGLGSLFQVPITHHRVVEPTDATAQIVLATGPFVEEVRSRPDAVEIASVDLRTPADVERFAALRTRVLDELQAEGLDDVAGIIDVNLFGAAVDERVPDVTRRLVNDMLAIGSPTSVFVLPAEAAS
jgi:hypothetical protein